MRYAVGVDLGGSFIKLGVVSAEGRLVEFEKVKTPEGRKLKDVVDVISFRLERLLEKYDVERVGIASPGSVTNSGIVLFSPNFPEWREVPLQEIFERRFEKRFVVDNDANAFAFGEREVGCARGIDDFILLTLGTGVGGAIFCGGKLLRGSMGIGAELGHILVGEKGPICGCGNIGCLETYSSASGVIKLAEEEGIEERYRDPAKLLRLYKEGDPKGVKVIEKAKRYLERALISYVHIFNPALIVFGGGLSKGWREILSDLQDRVNLKVMPSFRNSFRISFSSLHDEAGVLGIALMVLKGER